MRILVADDQAAFRDLVVTSIKKRSNHEIVVAEDGAQALELALAAPRPEVLVLDWVMPKLTGTQVCRLVRGTPLEVQPYVLFVTGRCRREELLQCLASGADDLLTKPFAPDVLMSRIELAQRRSQARTVDVSLTQALIAARNDGSGELVVKSGRISARILFCDGKIGWVQFADSFGSLLDAVAPQTGLDAEAAQAIVADCRRTGKGLTETLSAWGLLDGERLRQIAKDWLRGKLSSLRRLEKPEFLFLPGASRCSPELLFDLEELEPGSTEPPKAISDFPEPPPPRVSTIPDAGLASAFLMTEAPDPSLTPILRQCMEEEAVLGVLAIDRLTGACLGRMGAEPSPDIAWAHVQIVNAIMQKEQVEDAHVGSAEHLHIVNIIPTRPAVLVYALVDAKRTNIAVARHILRAAVNSKSPDAFVSRRAPA